MRELTYIRSMLGGERHFLVGETRVREGMKTAFGVQRGQAKRRSIKFNMTFTEWADIWLESGHWFERGTRADQYVMGRLGDVGPYAVGNVKIITVARNGHDAQSGRVASPETRQKQSIAMKDREITDEHRAKLSAANKGKKPWRGEPCTEKTRKRMSDHSTAMWTDPEFRRRMMAARSRKK